MSTTFRLYINKYIQLHSIVDHVDYYTNVCAEEATVPLSKALFKLADFVLVSYHQPQNLLLILSYTLTDMVVKCLEIDLSVLIIFCMNIFSCI